MVRLVRTFGVLKLMGDVIKRSYECPVKLTEIAVFAHCEPSN